uniref:Uncharacterized protein n=1 Tax=Chromera velia CCMP2878 TaxID=1169474 RepID=A0A0G4H936_9ALVE|eukprot:Cvel_25330.t1-p1 / transcript=Cvel_25330.t1 / gene=Cvel_25330 / organism=Chromera_velia_CCMP2878 / gene_product=hypothetical protein / transcript_product=hypothetical protein / location=Cvel_scaffold2854:7611-8454(+) / protein_length=93 / sequence_SO=supercontig / SO=protein_coding / is_pseudo=false
MQSERVDRRTNGGVSQKDLQGAPWRGKSEETNAPPAPEGRKTRGPLSMHGRTAVASPAARRRGEKWRQDSDQEEKATRGEREGTTGIRGRGTD